MVHGGCIYVMTNERHTVLYTGVTADLYARVSEHVECIYPHSSTAKYNIKKLIYYETFHHIEQAIAREKQFKKLSREKKVSLITKFNPQWKDQVEEVKYW